jgi:4'-phosphopantetheinyl transferase
MPAGPTYKIDLVDGLDEVAKATERPLGPGEVILATARPAESEQHWNQEALLLLLSDDERRRLRAFRFERDRRLFLVAHALLRLALSRHEAVAPGAWQFSRGTHGRPEIAAPASRMRFSLSHAHGLAACAVTLDRDIGLDVEHLSREPAMNLAERFFAPREAGDLLNAPPTERSRRFLEYWTLKEAYVKARGLGLSLPLDRFAMYGTPEGTWTVSFEPPLDDDPSRWWFWSSAIRDTHQAALAIG